MEDILTVCADRMVTGSYHCAQKDKDIRKVVIVLPHSHPETNITYQAKEGHWYWLKNRSTEKSLKSCILYSHSECLRS